MEKEPKVIKKYTDNGEHSHYELIDVETHEVLWSEESKTEHDELFGLIESIHHLFESDKPIKKDSVIGVAIELAYKTFKD